MTAFIVQQKDLSSEEVKELVYSYEGSEVTNELASFGQIVNGGSTAAQQPN